MASTDTDAQDTTSKSPDKPQTSTASSTTEDSHSETRQSVSTPQNELPKAIIIYTKHQLLWLSKSPLVKPPAGMPELRDWFGADNEQNLSKKESEPNTPNSARERRFRRDADDGETSSRPSFRSALSQPSQMGNFKHQPLRSADRDLEKEKEKDTRDKEGQERLRNLSDKFDRDRLALPLSGLRNKDRDSTSHLSGRLSGQSQLPTIASRRAEARESKKRNGETNDDWRRGPDSRRGRDERTDNRDERARSRGRDSSRPRRDEKEKDRKDRDDGRKEREGDSRRDRDRRDRDRDRGHDLRRDRDKDDSNLEAEEDPRRWRDDGKRDERLAARRERDRNKQTQEGARDVSSDRRWTTVEERDSKSKRGGARDKKALDEGKNRDDRRSEREKEKEPAWMDTYIPPPSSAGILGGKEANGELDGIQAWKKELKDKEQKEQKSAPLPASKPASSSTAEGVEGTENQMDEIQLFKMLMKREQNSKQNDPSEGGDDKHSQKNSAPLPDTSPDAVSPTKDNAQSLLNILTSGKTPQELAHEGTSSTSRLFPHPIAADSSPSAPAEQTSPYPSTSNQFNPPVGSRLLAFGNRQPVAPSGTAIAGQPLSVVNEGFQVTSNNAEQGHEWSSPSFSPFEEHKRSHLAEMQRNRQNDGLESNTWSEADSALNYPQGKGGSRFAKFFDGKQRDNSPFTKTPDHLGSTYNQGQDSAYNADYHHPPGEARTIDDIFAMLNNSVQNQRPHLDGVSHTSPPDLAVNQQLQAQQLHPMGQYLNINRRNQPMYENRLDRGSLADVLASSGRSMPGRKQENGTYMEPMEENAGYIENRIPSLNQNRLVEQGYPSSMYVSNVRGSTAVPQAHFRGGPSPMANSQAGMQNHHQRLPPGLANLGGRPPHDPSQFVGMPAMTTTMHNVPQSFPGGQFSNGHVRPPQMNLQQTSPAQHPISDLSHPNNMELRSGTQSQMFGNMSRVAPGGYLSGNPHAQNPLQNQMFAMRQQQQQQPHILPPNLIPQLIPQHLQQPVTPSNSHSNELMALLMGGPPRD